MSQQTILIVDDDSDFRQLLKPGLEAAGFAVLEARNGEEAKTCVRAQHPSLAIVDGLLPDSDGTNWIAWLRKSGQNIPVAFVSAFKRDNAQFRRLVSELRIGLVLRKPVNAANVVQRIQHLLQGLSEGDDPAGESAEAALAALRQVYGQGLPNKIRELTTALNRVRGRPEDTEALDESRAQAHRLRGTAGSYGFTELGEEAGRIEDALVSIGEQPEHRQSLLALIGLSIRELIRLAGDAAGTPGAPPEAVASTPLPAPPLAPAAYAVPAAYPVPAASQFPMETLLIVDDDPEFLRFASELARQHSVTPITATTSANAIAKARATRPDAALLDVNLGPDELSFRLVHELRTLPGLERLPVGFMSAEQRFDNRVAAAYAGASCFVTKPLDPTAFGTAVRQLLAAGGSERPTVLLVEADRASAALTVAALQAVELRVRAVPDPKLVPGLVAELRPDLLLLDTGVRGLSAYDLCRALRLDSATQDLPIVFLANSIGPEDRLPAYLAGGDDLLQKPVIVEELQTRVRNLIDRARLRADRASLDPMTGLQLRGSFLRELASFGVAQRSTVVALLDLDGMTRLNERRGYAAGDRALTALGRQVRRSFMSDVLRGRWGDDEIALAFPGEDLETVGLVMRRVQRDFAQTTLLDRTGVGFQLSFSVGMAVSPADGENSEELLRAAERRLQAARAIAAGSLVSAG